MRAFVRLLAVMDPGVLLEARVLGEGLVAYFAKERVQESMSVIIKHKWIPELGHAFTFLILLYFQITNAYGRATNRCLWGSES